MPRKSIEDGPTCSKEEADSMASLWDEHAKLRGLATSAKRLMQDSKGLDVVSPTLDNMQHNHEVLMVMAEKMKARRRLSADPMDAIIIMFLGWYEEHKVLYQQSKGFDPQTWAFKDAWSAHKIFSKLRQKVVKDESPRKPRIEMSSVSIFI